MLLPDRVVNRIWTAPWPPPAASDAAVDTVISSIASSRGDTIVKNPSVVFRVLSCTFTPSSVMLIAPCGSPLIVELRLLLGVLTPGRKVTKSSTLRLVSGRLSIDFTLIVDETADDTV